MISTATRIAVGVAAAVVWAASPWAPFGAYTEAGSSAPANDRLQSDAVVGVRGGFISIPEYDFPTPLGQPNPRLGVNITGLSLGDVLGDDSVDTDLHVGDRVTVVATFRAQPGHISETISSTITAKLFVNGDEAHEMTGEFNSPDEMRALFSITALEPGPADFRVTISVEGRDHILNPATRAVTDESEPLDVMVREPYTVFLDAPEEIYHGGSAEVRMTVRSFTDSPGRTLAGTTIDGLQVQETALPVARNSEYVDKAIASISKRHEGCRYHDEPVLLHVVRNGYELQLEFRDFPNGYTQSEFLGELVIVDVGDPPPDCATGEVYSQDACGCIEDPDKDPEIIGVLLGGNETSGFLDPGGVERIFREDPPGDEDPEANIVIEKTVSPAIVEPGDTVTYTIVVTNEGPDSASGVVMRDVVAESDQYRFVSADTGDGICQVEPARVECSFGILGMGDSATATVGARITAQGGAVLNSAVAVSDTNDPDPVNVADTSVTVVPPAGLGTDLAVTKQPSGRTFAPGDTVLYTIEVTNQGNEIAGNVVLEDRNTGGLEFVGYNSVVNWVGVFAPPSDFIGGGGSCTFPEPTLFRCQFGQLQPNTAGWVLAEYRAIADGGEVQNRVVATSTTRDLDPGNNVAEATIFVGSPPIDLEIDKVDSNDPVAPGDQLTYLITVANLSDAYTATGVYVQDTLPPESLYLDARTVLGGCGASLTTVECRIDEIGPGQIAEIQIAIATRDGFEGTMTNRVTVEADQGDPDMLNNTAEETTLVQAQSDPLLCALGIEPGDYVSQTQGCGVGDAPISCSSPAEANIGSGASTIRCNELGACNRNNTILGVGGHECFIENLGDGVVRLNCEQLGSGPPPNRCQEIFGLRRYR